MEEVTIDEVRPTHRKLRARLDQIAAERAKLENEEGPLRATVEGMEAMFPDLASRTTYTPALDIVLGDADRHDAVAEVKAFHGTRGALWRIFVAEPERWFTVKDLTDRVERENPTKFANAEAAVRKALRSMNGDLSREAIDGRSYAYRWRTAQPAGGG